MARVVAVDPIAIGSQSLQVYSLIREYIGKP